MKNFEKKDKRTIFILILIFIVFSIGISTIGFLNYKVYRDDVIKEFKKELSTVTELKSRQIEQWRKERMQDGNMFYLNISLAEHIKSYFKKNNDEISKNHVVAWMKKVQDIDEIETVYLLDSNLMKRIVVPENNERNKAYISPANLDSLKSGKIVFEDFFRYENEGKVYLKVLIPIFDNIDSTKFIGAIQIRIDPDIYLYPLINTWPSPTETAETVILRGEGKEVVFLNELKQQKNTALNLRTPLEKDDYVAVKAVKGKTGIVEGIDYTGDEVISCIEPIKSSPWIIVTRVDKAEVFTPIKERFLIMLFNVMGINLIVGSVLLFIWRNQRTKFYKAQYKSTEALRKSEERFRLLYEASPVAYQSLDENGNLLEVNNSWLVQLGYTYQEVIGHNFGEFLTEQYKELFKERFPNFMKIGEVNDLEFDFYKKDGSKITTSFSGKIGYNAEGEFAQTHCVFTNITDRKKYEKELQESKEKYLRIFESTGTATMLVEADASISMVNNGFMELSGYSSEEILGTKWTKYVSPECLPQLMEYNKLRFQNPEKAPKRYEAKLINKKGETRDSIIEVGIISYTNQLVVSILDITKLKQTEKEVLKLNRVFQVLSNINQSIVRITEINKLFDETCKIAVHDGKFLKACIGKVNTETKSIEILASEGLSKDNLNDKDFDLSFENYCVKLANSAIESGTHFVLNDLLNDEKTKTWITDLNISEYKSFGIFPIKVFDNVSYLFALYSGEKDFFDLDEIKLLDELVSDLSFALEFKEREQERKSAEDALKESRQRYKDIFDYAPVGIYQSTRNGKIITANNRLLEILGYESIEEIQNLVMQKDIYSDEDEREKLIDKFEPSGVGENIEIKWKKKDGTPIWISLNSHIFIKENNETYFEGFVRDITEKKFAEDILKESEEKYRNLIETMPEGFYRSTPEGYFVDVNPAFVKMLGYESKEELMKVYIPESLYFSKNDREDILGNINFIPNTEIYRLKKKDGSEVWIEDFARYIKDEKGNIIFHEGIMRDITKLLRAQKEIIEAKEKAEEISRLKSSFLANMSHEIRTPLNGILGFTEILKEELTDSEHLRSLDVIQKSSNRLLETLDMILNFSKLEAEMVTAHYSLVNVENVFIEVLNNFEAMARNKGLYVKHIVKQKKLSAKIDERFLRLMLNNLIKNAIVYTKEGGITVTLERKNENIIIKVTDTGIGIAKENQEIIFEPFRQESEGFGRNFEGTGLGLSISKRFVELMNGKIEVESEKGKGSTFTISLPCSESKEITETKIKSDDHKSAKTKISRKDEIRILNVENDEANLMYSNAILNKLYKTDSAVDGTEAIEKARNNVYDIILMDINLGKGIDGLKVAQEIRKFKEYKETPIIAVTAFVREGDKEEFLKGGCTHYLGKPYSGHQLLELISNIINAK